MKILTGTYANNIFWIEISRSERFEKNRLRRSVPSRKGPRVPNPGNVCAPANHHRRRVGKSKPRHLFKNLDPSSYKVNVPSARSVANPTKLLQLVRVRDSLLSLVIAKTIFSLVTKAQASQR